MGTAALCIDVTKPDTIVNLTRNDSCVTWASARCDTERIHALRFDSDHAFRCWTLGVIVLWLYIAQSSTSSPRIPISPSRINVLTPQRTLPHAKDMHSNKSARLRP